MILSDLRSYLQMHRRAALSDMALRFDTEPAALRGMLAKWVSKGRVVKLSRGPACGSTCCHCAPETIEIYEWRE